MTRQVTWNLPKILYTDLQELQESLRGRDTLTRKWGSMEDFVVHILAVAVREAHKELQIKSRRGR